MPVQPLCPNFNPENTPNLMLMRNQCCDTCDRTDCNLAINSAVYPRQPNKVHCMWLNVKHHQVTTCRTDYCTMLITKQKTARSLKQSAVWCPKDRKWPMCRVDVNWLLGYSHKFIGTGQSPQLLQTSGTSE